jgi:hypothetical protein
VLAPPETGNKKKGKARRISAPPIATGAATQSAAAGALVPPPGGVSALVPSPSRSFPAGQGGALPHKSPKAEGAGARATDTTQLPSGTAPPAELPIANTETTEAASATPATPAEQRAEAAARADADGVRFVVSQRLPQVHACYSRAFKENSPGGRVDIGFVIGQSGRASKIRVEQNTTGSPALGKCLEQRVAEWEFPRPSSGEFELIYPFVFSPGT